MQNAFTPSEESLQRILSGELPDPVSYLDADGLELIVQSKTCPRDARPLSDRDNPRHPGLNRELFCSCGFSTTT